MPDIRTIPFRDFAPGARQHLDAADPKTYLSLYEDGYRFLVAKMGMKSSVDKAETLLQQVLGNNIDYKLERGFGLVFFAFSEFNDACKFFDAEPMKSDYVWVLGDEPTSNPSFGP